MRVMCFILLVWHFQVFLIHRLKLGFSVKGDDCSDVLDGLCSNLWRPAMQTLYLAP